MTSRQAIVDLVQDCAAAVGAFDADRWAAQWTDDATWDLAGHVTEGIEAIRETWEQSMEMFGSVVQRIHRGTVEVDGDTATGGWLISEQVQSGHVMLGFYDDVYAHTDDGWRFARRAFTLLGQGTEAVEDPSPEIVLVGTTTLAADAREAAIAEAAPLMDAARTQDGCIAYVFAADPVDADTISIHEHWRDAASLEAHLAGPHYTAMLVALSQHGLTDVSVAKHEIRRSAPVYDDGGVATASFESG